MDTFDIDVDVADEYIGDELTWGDLQKGYSAFLEDMEAETAQRERDDVQ